MKSFIFLTALLGVCFGTYSQDIRYIHRDLSYDQVTGLGDDQWLVLKEDIYEGLDNGVYWFQIKALPEGNLILHVPSAHIFHTKLYYGQTEIGQIPNNRFPSFRISKDKKREPYYLKVTCKKEAIIPVRISEEQAYHHAYSNQNIYLGLYYGIVLAVIMFNLFSFINYRNKTYLYYVLVLISTTLGLACSDGLNIWLINDHWIHVYLEPFFNLCVGISIMLFATIYLQLDKYLPKIQRVGGLAVLISIILFITYLYSGNFLIFSITEISILIVLSIYWFSAIYLFKKNVYARFFSIAYGIILFSSFDFYISPHFGLHVLDLNLNQFRIGAIAEMVVFTYAIAYQGKELLIEKQKITEKIKNYTSRAGLETNNEQELIKYFMDQHDLTQQEIKILEGISKGMVNKEIAEEHNISVNTVKFHIRNIYKKLEINTRKEASLKYFEANS
ncbi:MAG: 7TM diverse intracellular signaling domain-containing protein [Marinoscillum sp.]